MPPGGGMQQGGAPMPAPNYRGMAAPPNQTQTAQMNQLPSNQMPTQGRMAPPWQQQTQRQGMQAAQQAPMSAAQAQAPATTPAATAQPGMQGQMQGRMPAPWMRPQAQGQGMGPAARQQTSGVQAPSNPQTLQNKQRTNTY